MEFALYRLCGSIHSSALVKQTCQCISILSHRLLRVHSSGSLITPVLHSGKPLFHAMWIALPLHGAYGKPVHLCECAWSKGLGKDLCCSRGVLSILFLVRSKFGGYSHMQTRSQPAICSPLFIQIPAIYDMKVKYTLIGVEACEIICLKLTTVFYQPGWCITTPRHLMLTAPQINLFSCADMSVVWSIVVVGHFSIFSGEKPGEVWRVRALTPSLYT